MAGPSSTDQRSGPTDSVHLLAEEAILNLPQTDQLLRDAARAAAAGVELSCGITYIARYGVVTVASSDARANAVDEIQYGAGTGPCLEAVQRGVTVRVDDLATETRWGRYRELALRAGVRSSLSLPLVVDERPIGALNVYSTDVGPLPPDQEAAATLAANQVAGILLAVRRLAANFVSDPDAVRDFQHRHELDVATGILMTQHGCTADLAVEMLRVQAHDDHISVRQVVVRTIAGASPGPNPRS